MARPQEKSAFFTAPYSPITERENESAEDDYPEAASGGCGCFRRFCFGFPESGESHNHLLQGGGGMHKDSWVAAKFKKLKELSEQVAGPKWKNLIRKMGKFCNPNKYNKQTTTHQFQYSPESYAMNFAGDFDDHEEDGNLPHSFSYRFAPHHALFNDQQRKPTAGL